MRCTVVYIGTVAIGLTVIELSEKAEGRYVNGEYVRLTDFVPKRRVDQEEQFRTRSLTSNFPTEPAVAGAPPRGGKHNQGDAYGIKSPWEYRARAYRKR